MTWQRATLPSILQLLQQEWECFFGTRQDLLLPSDMPGGWHGTTVCEYGTHHVTSAPVRAATAANLRKLQDWTP